MNYKRKNQDEKPSSLADILGGSFLKDIKKKVTTDTKVKNKWNEVVGETIASMSKVISFKQGFLNVEVNSSALLSELEGIYKKELMLSMGEGDNPVVVNHISFKLAGSSR